MDCKGIAALAEANEFYENGRKAFDLKLPVTYIDGYRLHYADEWKKG